MPRCLSERVRTRAGVYSTPLYLSSAHRPTQQASSTRIQTNPSRTREKASFFRAGRGCGEGFSIRSGRDSTRRATLSGAGPYTSKEPHMIGPIAKDLLRGAGDLLDE